MALHGEIWVNHGSIGYWEAVRIETVSKEPLAYSYRCHVEYTDQDNNTHLTGPFIVHHVYEQGALILASKVLARANYLMKSR